MTISPIFDQLTRRRRPTSSPLDRGDTPVFASVSTARRSSAHRAVDPVSAADLSDQEREAGTAVARLLLQLLDDSTATTRRWPFHPVR